MPRFPRSFHISSAPRYAGALFLLGTAFSSTPAKADFFVHFWENQHQSGDVLNLSGAFQYLGTDTNYDALGQSQIPLGLRKYARAGGEIALSLGATPELTAFGRVTWARVDLDSTVRPSDSFGFTDQTVGMNYRIHESKVPGSLIQALDLQAQLDFPIYNNDVSDSNLTPRFGDQTLDATFGGFVTTRLQENRKGSILVVSGAGYTYRSQDFSAAVPWSVSFKYLPKGSGFYGSLSTLGLLSLQTDPRGNNLTLLNSTAVASGTGGSFMSGAINPSLLSVRGEVGFETAERLRVVLSATQTVSGKDAPAGLLFVAALQKQIGGKASFGGGGGSGPTGAEIRGTNEGFVNYTFEAKVVKASDRLNLVRLDKGSFDGVEMGQEFDVFTVRTDGTLGEPIARGRVTAVKGNESTVTISEYFKEVWIEEGFIAKRPIH